VLERTMEPHSIYFPDPEEIQPLAVAFAQMMFAHAAFERQVRELQDVITGISGFGDRPSSQWSTPTRAGRMAKLIVKHRGLIREAQPINNVLTNAVRPCLDRNLLAHGEWWRFDRQRLTIDVRGKRHSSPWTKTNINSLTENFQDLEAELYKLRRAIEQRAS
jgi:hypothetical protein